MNNQYTEEKREEIINEVESFFNDFVESKYFKELEEKEKREAYSVITNFAEYSYDYMGLTYYNWNLAVMEECCLEILPRKISAKKSYFEVVSPVLANFFSFLAEEGVLDNGFELAIRVKEIKNQIIKNSQNPKNWGMAKSFVMKAMESGVDVTSEVEMNELLKQHNREQLKNLKENEGPSVFESSEEPPKVGRNEACPCGSGKKYKHCCLRVRAEHPKGYYIEKIQQSMLNKERLSEEVYEIALEASKNYPMDTDFPIIIANYCSNHNLLEEVEYHLLKVWRILGVKMDENYLYGLIALLIENDKCSQAEEMIKKVEEEKGETVELLLVKSDLYIKKESYDLGLMAINKAFELAPDDEDIIRSKIDLLIKVNRYEEALELFYENFVHYKNISKGLFSYLMRVSKYVFLKMFLKIIKIIEIINEKLEKR